MYKKARHQKSTSTFFRCDLLHNKYLNIDKYIWFYTVIQLLSFIRPTYTKWHGNFSHDRLDRTKRKRKPNWTNGKCQPTKTNKYYSNNKFQILIQIVCKFEKWNWFGNALLGKLISCMKCNGQEQICLLFRRGSFTILFHAVVVWFMVICRHIEK